MGEKIAPKIPILKLPYTADEIDFLKNGFEDILKSGFLTMDKKVFEFENLFSEFIGVKYSVAVNSGTSALEIPLRAFDVRNKSVIVPTNTFMATPLSVIHAGGKVTFVDVMKDNLSIDPVDLKNKITDNTVGVIPVHIGGIISPFWDEIMEICNEHNLFVIEDAAHAHGSSINERMAGTLADAAAFSFYPTKVLNTAEGGMITTNNEDIYKKSIIFREHGKKDHSVNVHSELGYNWRFSELHALLGIQQMHKARDILNERRRQARIYDSLLDGAIGLNLVKINASIRSSYYKYIVFLDPSIKRSEVKKIMKDKYGIMMTGEVYSDLCHSQPVFSSHSESVNPVGSQSFFGAKFVSERQICPPLYPGLTDDEIEYIAESLKKTLVSLSQNS
jgi:dTDP-4-amino-4,6-dideoxygalactose transaminase